MRYVTPLFTALLLLPVAAVRAQQPVAVSIGQRVRVRTDSGTATVVTGTLVGQDSLAIQLQVLHPRTFLNSDAPESTIVTVPVARVRQLEVSTGRRRNAGRGAVIGLGVGAGLGLALGIAAMSDPWLKGNAGDVATVTVVTGVVGAGIGALVGLAASGDRWEVVRPAGVRISLVPRRSSIMLGGSLTF